MQAGPQNLPGGGGRSERYACLALVVIISTDLSAEPQPSTQAIARPIGDEAFRVLTSFHEYDPENPLEARVAYPAR